MCVCDGMWLRVEVWVMSEKIIKSLKCKGVKPLILVYKHVVAIVRRGGVVRVGFWCFLKGGVWVVCEKSENP